MWLSALGGMAAALVAVVTWFHGQDQQRIHELVDARLELRRANLELARYQQAMRFLDSPETRLVGFGQGQQQPPRGNVFVNASGGVMLIAANLPQLAAGRTYEMWLIPRGQAPRPAGLFKVRADGSAVHILEGQVDTRSLGAVAVSDEPEAGSPAPSTTPIIVAPVSGL